MTPQLTMADRWWLWRHRRHGTGPIRKTVNAGRLDRSGKLVPGTTEPRTFYRCECRAVRPVS